MISEEIAKVNPSVGNTDTADIQRLLAQAREAEARYDHESAVSLYTTALDLPGLTLEEQYEIFQGRAFATYNWGIPDQVPIAARSVIDLARKMGDKRRLAEALAVNGFWWRKRSGQKPPVKLTEEALQLAEAFDDDRLRAYCHPVLAMNAWTTGDPDKAWEHLDLALEAARQCDDEDILFEVNHLHAYSHEEFGRKDEALRFLDENLALVEKSGSELKRYGTMLLYGNTVRDLAAKRDYYEQELQAEIASGYQNGNSSITLAVLYWRLGLYRRAQDYAAAGLNRAKTFYSTDFANNSIGRILLAKGLLDEAEAVYRQVAENPESNYYDRAWCEIGLAEIALARGRPSEAAALFRHAPEFHKSVHPVDLVGLGAAHLAMNRLEEALDYTSRSVAFLQGGKTSSELHEQEIWWRHYQVLKAAAQEDPYSALDQARKTMLTGIETLSDEGLRRNYLNKVAVNRDIILTWTAEAHKRGIPLDPFTNHEPLTGHLRAQFRRVVDTGARLTAQHDPQTLAGFIVDEFVEMSGAERVLLIRDEESGPAIIAAHNPENAAELAAPLLQKMGYSRQTILEQDVGEVSAGEIPELHLRSVVALPLVASDRFLGLIYGDMRQIFGRFNEADVQLLGMLANQAAAALENADLVSTLEERVEQRTSELEQRNNELAIINSVQEGLVAELDLQMIFEIVGKKISTLYGADSFGLFTYDDETDLVHGYYLKELGQRYTMEPRRPTTIARFLLETRKPILLQNRQQFEALGHSPLPGTIPAQSAIYIPLIAGDHFVGAIHIYSYQENSYDETDMRLLTTLANSMSVAMENARLFTDAFKAREEAEAAREAAESANEAKSAFMSNMSHELRTPLNAIIGFTRIVKRKTKSQIPQKQTDNLDKVLSSGQHLLGLINTVLDIAKIEAGRMDVIISRFPIDQLIEAVSNIAQPLLRPGVELVLNSALDLPEINSDQDKIKQILLNLLSNAAKFTHEGSITVSAYPNGRMIHIDVSDSGIGMSEEALGRVFEEFQQADATTRKKYGGTGLGMPISKHLAQLLGGDLTVTSSKGEGSTFTLVLPVKIPVS